MFSGMLRKTTRKILTLLFVELFKIQNRGNYEDSNFRCNRTRRKGGLKQALESGFDVQVLVRNTSKLGDLKDKVEIIEGSLERAEDVINGLQGCEAVINAAGGIKKPDQFETFITITNNIVSAMKHVGIKKLVSINGAGTILPNEYVGFQRRIISVIVGLMLKHMKVAKQAEMSVLLETHDIDWVSVRAPMFSKKPIAGTVTADDYKMPGAQVNLSDLAQFMVNQVASTKWVQKAPFVATVG